MSRVREFALYVGDALMREDIIMRDDHRHAFTHVRLFMELHVALLSVLVRE